MKSLIWVLVVLIRLGSGEARTIIVAADSSGDYLRIAQGVDSARAGDSVLVRDGDYYGYGGGGEGFAVDSSVVVLAEHHGAARIMCAPAAHVIDLIGSAKLIGFQIFANPVVRATTLVYVRGGPATLFNCQFHSAGSLGEQLRIASNGSPPFISQCSFQVGGPLIAVYDADSTNVWMPNNNFGMADTAFIHQVIWDGNRFHGNGFVYISPVLDSFQWLAARNRQLLRLSSPTLQAFPNPTQGAITVVIPGGGIADQLEVFNLLGQCVWSQNPTGLDLHSMMPFQLPLPVGSYFLHVKERGTNHTVRITIIH